MSMLTAIGKLYGLIVAVRNTFYDRGIFRSYSLGARTISIGNITTGGTGKTPLVAYVAEILADAGEKVCILTRGYGRKNERERVLVSDGTNVLVDARTGGDEPVELAAKLTGKAIVVADADRVGAAAWAMEKFGITAFVLDDGFQHRRAKRDLDIVCIDATNPLGGGRALSTGIVREPVENLKRAGAIAITRSNLVDDVDAVVGRLRRQNSEAPLFVSWTRVVGATRLGARAGAPEWASLRRAGNGDNEVRVLAFCGLGNPDAFFTGLQGAFAEVSMSDEVNLAIIRKFPDHHYYAQSDIADLEQRARDAGVHALITTAKDAVKLEGLKFDLPCFVVQSTIVIDDAEAFRDLVISS